MEIIDAATTSHSRLCFRPNAFLPGLLLGFAPMANADAITVGIGDVDFASGHVFRIADRRHFDAAAQQVLAQSGQIGGCT